MLLYYFLLNKVLLLDEPSAVIPSEMSKGIPRLRIQLFKWLNAAGIDGQDGVLFGDKAVLHKKI